MNYFQRIKEDYKEIKDEKTIFNNFPDIWIFEYSNRNGNNNINIIIAD
jgi:hypothetical protein